MEEWKNIMIMLNTDFSNEEKDILKKYAGKAYDVLSSIEGKSYALNNIKGEYLYNDCFKPTTKTFFAKQRYEEVVPFRVIKFYQFYLMNIKGENIWYRGRKDENGNWEYTCYSDSLEEAFECL
jgi:hypothetical protein